jgi:hypothetical protein
MENPTNRGGVVRVEENLLVLLPGTPAATYLRAVDRLCDEACGLAEAVQIMAPFAVRHEVPADLAHWARGDQGRIKALPVGGAR